MKLTTSACTVALAAAAIIGSAQESPYYRFTTENMRAINSPYSDLSLLPLTDTTYLLVSDRGAKNAFGYWSGGVPYDLLLVNRRNYTDIVPAEGLNSDKTDGPATLLSEGSIYLTRTNAEGVHDPDNGIRQHHLNISRADLTDGIWEVKEQEILSSPDHAYAHPAVSEDGNMLFFASDLPGGHGGMDLYVSHRSGSGWGAPINLGPVVNSSADELYPFWHASGTLYFSSRRAEGMGGADIYSTTLRQGNWTLPQNPGAPLNSSGNEFSVYFDRDMTRGFVSSDRPGGRGAEDVYAVFVDKIEQLPEAEAADNAYREPGEDAGPTTLADEETVPGGIYFSAGSHTLDPNGMASLNDLHRRMVSRTAPVLEICAYSEEESEYSFGNNLLLTEQRARTIIRYLLEKGIASDRLLYVIYGLDGLNTAAMDDVHEEDRTRKIVFRMKIYDHQFSGEIRPNEEGYAFKQLPMLESARFFVQLAALSPGGYLTAFHSGGGSTELICYLQGGLYKYVTGPYLSYEEAAEQLNTAKEEFGDAFIFKNE